MRIQRNLSSIALAAALLAGVPMTAFAEISFVSAGNQNASLYSTVANDDGGNVFVFKGLADGDTSTLSFSTDAACPYVAVTGGAQFNSQFTCVDGVISADVTYKGGLSFGPATDDSAGSFYVTFSNPPTPEGLDAPPSELSGIQFSLYGDISKWSVTGGQTSSGISFGIELSGSQGGEEHLLMELPSAAASYLGSVLGMTVGGKPNPFAEITTREDGSVALAIDITDLQKSNVQSLRPGALATTIKKKFLAGARSLGIASAKSSVRAGKSVSYAMCAGTSFTAGDVVPVKFTIGGKAKSSLKNIKMTLDSKGCAKKTVSIPKSAKGTLVAKITYKGKNASATTKVL